MPTILSRIDTACSRLLQAVTLMSLVVCAPLAAEETPPASPPPSLAFPKDTILYGEIRMTEDMGALWDFDGWEQAKVIGFSAPDISEMLSRVGLKISDETLRQFRAGFTRAAGGLVDVTLDGPTWLVVLEHAEPQLMIDVLNATSASRLVSFKESGEVAGTRLYELQVPLNWLDDIGPWKLRRQMNWWGNTVSLVKYSPPITLAVWKSKYLIVGSVANYVKDALEFFDFPEDQEFSLTGKKHFAECEASAAGAECFLYWDVASTLEKLRRATPHESGPWGNNAASMFLPMLETIEVQQFRQVSLIGNYDATHGQLDARIRVDFFNEPSWLRIAMPTETTPAEAKPTSLTAFCPPTPALFLVGNVNTPLDAWHRVKTFVKDKADAIGHPEFNAQFTRDLEAFKKKMGFDVDQLLEQLGSEQAVFQLPPFEDTGARRRGDGVCIVAALRDADAAQAFIEDKLADAAELRDVAVHTSEIEFMDFAGKPRISYRVFNAGDSASFSWCIVEGHLLIGTQDAVRAGITARMTGLNLAQHQGYLAFRPRLPEGVPGFCYFDLAYLAQHAAKAFPRSTSRQSRSSNPWSPWEDQGERRPQFEMAPWEQADSKTFMAQVFSRFGGNLRSGISLEIANKAVTIHLAATGLLTRQTITETVGLLAREDNRRAAWLRMRDELGPELLVYLLRHGDLPATPEEFAAGGGEPELFRDPMLAGPGVKTPTQAQSLVWLGRHGDTPLLPPIPLAHTRVSEGELALLLMSDGSVHVLKPDELDAALTDASQGRASRLASASPQTLEQALDHFAAKLAREQGNRRR